MTKNSLNYLTEKLENMTLIGPTGDVVKAEHVLSIRGVRVNDVKELDTKFSVDFLDLQGIHHSNYICSFDTLNLVVSMLFAESELEDSTKITVNFDALATLLIMSWIKGLDDTANHRQFKENDLDYSEEDVEEYNKNKNNMLVN